MSLVAVQPAAPQQQADPVELPEGMTRRGLALSGGLHLGLLAVLIFGLPTLFRQPPPQEMPIAVDLVNIGPETRATHANPRPQHAAKPVEPLPGPPAVKPEPKPEPPPPTAPSSAAAAPNLEPPARPEPKPQQLPPPPLPQAKPLPPPKPVEPVTAPRPPEKPAPPKRASENAARAQAKHYDPGRFDALLRNLAAADNTPPSDTLPRPSPSSGRASSQPRAPLGSRLSASELDLVREQIAHCWNVPAGARDAKDLVVEIRVVVDPDGNVTQATIVDQARGAGDPFFRAAAESARRAFFNPECRPLRLPPDKYDIWRDMVVDFSPRDLL
jgi:outer membrane biosynthesis protein TonB